MAMENDSNLFMPLLVLAAVFATAAVLMLGISRFARKPQAGEDPIARAKASNKMMQWRIKLQALAIILFLLMLYFLKP